MTETNVPVTDEMVEIAHAVINREIGAECPTPSECAACDALQATTAILEAVAPLIAAAALRDAADKEMAAWEQVPMSPDWLDAVKAVFEDLRALADRIEREEDDDTRDSGRD